MSFGKKLTRAFNRAVTHGSYIAASVVMSLGIGIGVSSHMNTTQSAAPPQANVAAHAAAAERLHRLGDNIVSAQARMDFSWSALESAKENIGKGNTGKEGGRISEQLADVNAGYTAYDATRAEQLERLKAFRRALLFDPALSEKEATDAYLSLWERSPTGDMRDFFSPFQDAMAYRDETVAALHVPLNPAAATEADAEKVTAAARAADEESDSREWKGGLAGGIGALGGLLALSFLGARNNRRRKEEGPETDDGRQNITFVIEPRRP